MTPNSDIRWKQRFANYQKAFAQLEKFLEKKNLNELEEQGLIQAFEYTYELAWNVLKDFLENQGAQEIYGARDTISESFKRGLITDGEGWMEMFKDRNKTSHTYSENLVKIILAKIRPPYFNLFKALREKLISLS